MIPRRKPLAELVPNLEPAPWSQTAAGRWWAGLSPILTLSLALLAWAVALWQTDVSRMGELGLITVLPIAFYAALAALTLSACLTVNRLELPDSLWLLHPVVWIVIVHGTPHLLYGTLRYSWAWKHIGIVDYLQRYGTVDPHIDFLSAYHNWPGFFTLNTLLTQVAGLESPLVYAGWAPVFFNLIDLGALWLIVTSLTDDRRLARLSIWFFFITSWVGQDYFAPQALSYFFHLVILGLCLRWLRSAAPPRLELVQRWLRWRWAARLVHGRLRQAFAHDPRVAALAPLSRAGLIGLICLLYFAIASSHQLTPFMTLVALSALVVAQRCNARTLPLIAGLLALLWLTFMASAFMHRELGDILTSIGQLERNLDTSLRPLGPISSSQQFVALMARGLTLGVWALAALGAVRRWRHGRFDLSALLLALAPFAMLGGSSYGGEILFRVFLFGLPFMAFLAATLVFASPAAGSGLAGRATAAALSGLLILGFLVAYYGKEQQYRFTRAEVEAAEFLYDTAPPNSLLIEGARNYPSQFRNYERFKYVPLASESLEERRQIMAQPVETFTRWMSDSRYSNAYLLITRSQRAMVESLGDLPVGALDRIEAELLESGRFRILYRNPDATIYVLAGRPPRPERASR